jgi:hypothetical protein
MHNAPLQGLEFRLMDCEDRRAEDTVLGGLCTQVRRCHICAGT